LARSQFCNSFQVEWEGMSDHDDFGGLQRDLVATGAAIDRRGLFRMAAKFSGAVGALQVFGCGGSPTQPGSTTTTTTTTTPATPTAGSCSRVPEETQGPYPGDGSNGPNGDALRPTTSTCPYSVPPSAANR